MWCSKIEHINLGEHHECSKLLHINCINLSSIEFNSKTITIPKKADKLVVLLDEYSFSGCIKLDKDKIMELLSNEI